MSDEAEASCGPDVEVNGDPADIPVTPRRSEVRVALVVSLLTVLTLTGLGGWMGYRSWESLRAQQQRALFLQVGRQAAVNLTTISYAEADGAVQRILDSATGSFYEDFQKRAPAFADLVKQAHSKSEGTVTEAGLESEQGDRAQVLVAVSVTSSLADTPAEPRSWRMRIGVERIGAHAKVSNVQFVP